MGSKMAQLFTRYLVAPKLLYFFVFVAIRAIVAYRVQFFRDVFQLTTADFGQMLAAYSIAQFLASFFWAFMVDRYRRPKLFLLVLSTIAAGLYMMYLLPEPRKSANDSTLLHVALISIAITAFSSASIPITDRICLLILENKKGASKELYGRQRLFGCFGDIVGTAIISLLVDKNRYHFLYVSVGVSAFLLLVFGLILIPKDHPEKAKDAERSCEKKISLPDLQVNVSFWEKFNIGLVKFGKLFTNRAFVFFLFVAFLNGICKAIGCNFVSNFLEDKMDGLSASKPQIAILSTSSYVFEITCFFASTFLLRRIGSFNLLIGAQVALIARFLIHACLPVGTQDETYIWIALIAESFKGINCGFMQAAGVMVCSFVGS